MKKFRLILPLIAFVFAISSAFSGKVVSQVAYYDNNGSTSGGGDEGEINNTLSTCSVQPGIVCKIGSHYAFDSIPHAVANMDANNDDAEGLLKF